MSRQPSTTAGAFKAPMAPMAPMFSGRDEPTASQKREGKFNNPYMSPVYRRRNPCDAAKHHYARMFVALASARFNSSPHTMLVGINESSIVRTLTPRISKVSYAHPLTTRRLSSGIWQNNATPTTCQGRLETPSHPSFQPTIQRRG